MKAFGTYVGQVCKHFSVCEFHDLPQCLQLFHHSSWSLHLKIFTLESCKKGVSLIESSIIYVNNFGKFSNTILLKSISKHQKASALSSKRTTKGDSRSLIPKIRFPSEQKMHYLMLKPHSINWMLKEIFQKSPAN